MSEVLTGGAPAPPDTGAAVLAADTTNHISPLNHQPLPEKEPAPAPRVSAADAVRMAQEKVAAAEKKVSEAKPQPKAEAKPAPKIDAPSTAEKPTEDRTRTETGQFAPKDAQPAKAAPAPEQQAATVQSEARVSRYEAPARFNDAGKAEWTNVPESVQAEVHRALKNLEDGHAKYKEASDRYEGLRRFDDIARQNGGDLRKSLEKVVEIETAFRANPIAGFQKVAEWAGVNLQQVAAHIMGQNPNVHVQQAHARIRELEGQLAEITRRDEVALEVSQFAQSHTDFDPNDEDIAFLIESGIIPNDRSPAERLKAAYEYKRRFGMPPASSAQAATPASSAVAQASPAPAQPNPAGQKSISGAPTPGSTYPAKKRAMSASEAVRLAMAQSG